MLMPVRKILFPLLGFVGLAACDTSLSTFYKPGAAVTRLQTDQTNCEVQALKDVPVANQVRQRAPMYFPGRHYCDASGRCWTSPGYWVDGGIYTVDVNTDLRQRVLAQCMARKGYQPVTIPACSPQVKQAVPAAQTAKLPQLTQNSCVIRYEDGGFQIVSPTPG